MRKNQPLCCFNLFTREVWLFSLLFCIASTSAFIKYHRHKLLHVYICTNNNHIWHIQRVTSAYMTVTIILHSLLGVFTFLNYLLVCFFCRCFAEILFPKNRGFHGLKTQNSETHGIQHKRLQMSTWQNLYENLYKSVGDITYHVIRTQIMLYMGSKSKFHLVEKKNQVLQPD